MTRLLTFLLLLAAATPALSHVDAFEKPLEDGSLLSAIVIQGDISPADIAAVQQYAAEQDTDEAGYKLLILNTNGGDLDSAMKIGRIIRARGYQAQVHPRSRCLSACVYILAAAKEKQVLGKVGVHRPYFETFDGPDAGKAISKALLDSKLYFKSVNIPEGLADLMFSTLPENMKILTPDELGLYRLNQDDFEYKEETDLRLAKSLGVTRAEYMRFKKELDYKCKIHMGDQRGMSQCIDQAKDEFLKSLKAAKN